MLTRRQVTPALAAGLLDAMASPGRAASVDMPFGNGRRPLVVYPQKRALIRLTERPPQLETPLAVFDAGPLTPNDAFFVRYHLAGLPLPPAAPATYRLRVDGNVGRPLELSLDQLRAIGADEIIAVNQCAGNGRGFAEPRVAGGQVGNGMMGCARWHGVALRRVLDLAGIRAGSVEVAFDGMDEPVAEGTPDFVKSLPIDHARDGEVMLAWAMGDQTLPFLNGYPLRLVVPGYFGTYWIKHLSRITVRTTALVNFWMTTAYRVPDNGCGCVRPGEAAAATRPIGRFKPRSLITNLHDRAAIPAGRPQPVRGIAFDGGSGIARVELSLDGGLHWQDTTLGADIGRYAFRQWQAQIRLPPGRHVVMARATARNGERQPLEPQWNPSGYQRNVVERLTLEVG